MRQMPPSDATARSTLLHQDEDVVRIILRRPPLNFLNLDILGEIEAHLTGLGDSPPQRALLLESEMSAFCGGLDMEEHSGETLFLLLEKFHEVIRLLNLFPRPTIAVVRGMALGAGNELAAFCDFVIASDKAHFGQPEINVGTIPSIAPLLLPSIVGPGRSLEMILTGKLISAPEAQRMGLIYRSVPDDRLAETVAELLGTIRGLSKAVVEVALQALRRTRTEQLENNLRSAESLYLNQLVSLEDAKEGARAFLEKRPPRWKHR